MIGTANQPPNASYPHPISKRRLFFQQGTSTGFNDPKEKRWFRDVVYKTADRHLLSREIFREAAAPIRLHLPETHASVLAVYISR